jgi:hypothetical protein
VVDVNQFPAPLFNMLFQYVIRYQFDGHSYVRRLPWKFWFPTTYRIGDKVVVFVSQESPHNVLYFSLKGKVFQVVSFLALTVVLISAVLQMIPQMEGSAFAGIAGLIILTLSHLFRELLLLRTYKMFDVAKGVVSDFRKRKDSDLDTIFFPVVTFCAGDKEFKFVSRSFYFDRKLLGAKVSVRYLRSSPVIAEVDNSRLYMAVIFWSAALMILIFFSLIGM